MSLQLRDGLANRPLDHVLEDLLVRFLVNAPNEDLSSVERVLFQVEEAQWFYTDFLRPQYPGLPDFKMKGFSAKILKKCPLIWKWGDATEALSKFGRYKSTIPVRGIALFNSDLSKVLLVKGYDSKTWSFPRGKISKGESDLECAIREVEEETSFNSRDLIDENDVVERTIQGKNYKIYLVKDVPEDFDFKPHARNEIASIEWFDIKALQKKIKYNPNHFFIVPAILKPIMRWIGNNKGTINEAELMLQAELKLKDYLGIGKQPEPSMATEPAAAGNNFLTNDSDAGRELLDILQGVKPTTELSEELSNDESETPSTPVETTINIPQSMATPYEHLMTNSIPDSVQNENPIFKTLPLFQGNQGNFAHQTITNSEGSINTPNPDSLEKPPSSFINSKELLSILSNKGQRPKDSPSEESRRSEHFVKNKAKAQELLNLFKKENSTDVDPSTDSEVNTMASNALEKSIQEESPEDSQPKKVTILKKPDNSENSNGLLDLLKGKSVQKEPETQKSPSSPANDLLGLLKKSSQPKSPEVLQPAPSNIDQGNELLGMLKKPVVEESNNQENFEDFEDFEDFDALNDEIQATTHDLSGTDYQQYQQTVNDVNTQENEYGIVSTPNNSNGPSKGNFRILKPGESLEDISQETKPETPKLHQGNDLLSLLHREPNPNSSNFNSPNNSLSAIYGSATDSTPSPPISTNRNESNASTSLLGLLNRKPSSPAPPQDQKASPGPNSSSKSAANDLLGLLRKPNN